MTTYYERNKERIKAKRLENRDHENELTRARRAIKAQDPEFRAAHSARVAKAQKDRRANDPVYREQWNAYQRSRYQARKAGDQ